LSSSHSILYSNPISLVIQYIITVIFTLCHHTHHTPSHSWRDTTQHTTTPPHLSPTSNHVSGMIRRLCHHSPLLKPSHLIRLPLSSPPLSPCHPTYIYLALFFSPVFPLLSRRMCVPGGSLALFKCPPLTH
jgi:hypothetical protein